MAKPYQYPIRPAHPLPKAGAVVLPDITRPDKEPVGLINGLRPGSREEWRVAVAGWTLKIPFDYQVEIRGGVRVRGGQGIDFVFHTPFATPVFVMGRYWHRMDAEEQLKVMIAEQYFHRRVVLLWDSELSTQEQAINTVRERLL